MSNKKINYKRLYRIVDSETGDEIGIYYLYIEQEVFEAYIEEYLDLCKSGITEYKIEYFIEWLKDKGIKIKDYFEVETIIVKY